MARREGPRGCSLLPCSLGRLGCGITSWAAVPHSLTTHRCCWEARVFQLTALRMSSPSSAHSGFQREGVCTRPTVQLGACTFFVLTPAFLCFEDLAFYFLEDIRSNHAIYTPPNHQAGKMHLGKTALIPREVQEGFSVPTVPQ